MIFTSPEFLFLFLPSVLILYYLLLKAKKIEISKWFLVICSLLFYGFGSPEFFLLFIIVILLNYIIGRYISENYQKDIKYRKRLLSSGIILNILILGYYKYYNFILLNLNYFRSEKYKFISVILPLGISFFTFQLIAYLVDSFQGKTKGYSFLNYLLFITFFPQLIVGPIVHHSDVVHQFESLDNKEFNYKNLAIGTFLFFLGAAKKIILADNLTGVSQEGFDRVGEISMYDAWSCAIGYTISYYFDLSGYADMAVGMGLLCNIHIPINFDSPYKARNFADYWRRWHITLSKFLGDYIFRSIYNKGDNSIRFYFAVMFTFFVSGIWHGAGYNFIVWGILNGVLVCLAHYSIRNNLKFPYILSWSMTFLFIVFMRVLFVSEDLYQAFQFFQRMLIPKGDNLMSMNFIIEGKLFILVLGFLICILSPNSMELKENFQFNKKYLIISILLIFIVISYIGNVNKFLYFQF